MACDVAQHWPLAHIIAAIYLWLVTTQPLSRALWWGAVTGPCVDILWTGLTSSEKSARADKIWADMSCFNPGEALFCLRCRPLKAAVREKGLSANRLLWQLVTRSLGFVPRPRPCVGRFFFIQYMCVSWWIERAAWHTACCVKIYNHTTVYIAKLFMRLNTQFFFLILLNTFRLLKIHKFKMVRGNDSTVLPVLKI